MTGPEIVGDADTDRRGGEESAPTAVPAIDDMMDEFRRTHARP